ncbi:Pre-rRNA-processing protein IPI1/Testis-expressed sequence 10 protein [Trema orientale]|uniref:Pre-rRNA-processing protein IPI1/Testis-expressed sequence 10 protein n=1 Tax=Trema orientale TaxID=63057 RepID=A0A2P5FI20_TREOI|nr:Pre-rRNA-processing protein IPI1/Testis-expressed sequence 10 protein [Trema orientale]
MAPSKAPSKKQKKGVDFRKIKRKIGRKLPPPKNATNTEIKSKAIILPEQSVAADKSGLAVNKRGLTLKQLLDQSSHCSAKNRKDALIGIRDLLHTYPVELTLHKAAVIGNLGQRIGDDDEVVRQTLYRLLKSVIFPVCKEEHQEFIECVMRYIFHAMTNLKFEVRLMAFKFLELVVEHYPVSFFVHAEKIFQNYKEILQMNKFYFQEKGKLKLVLSGLLRCLSLLPCNKREDDLAEQMFHSKLDFHKIYEVYSAIIGILEDLVLDLVNYFREFIPAVKAVTKGLVANDWAKTISTIILKKFPLEAGRQVSEKVEEICFTLNSTVTELYLHLSERIPHAFPLEEKFLEFIENALLGKICNGTRSGKSVQEKILLLLIPFIPKLVSQVASDWKSRLLEAFTKTFMDCNPQSSRKLACLSTIKHMIIPIEAKEYLVPDILNHQITWIQELPYLLMLGDKHQSCCEVVLSILYDFATSCTINPLLAQEFENMQFSLRQFYSTCLDDGNILSGPFVRLPRNSQKLAFGCVRFFRSLDPSFLTSITQCCLCPDLEPQVLFDIIDALHVCASYPPVNLKIEYYFSFCITLLSEFRVFPENIFPFTENIEPNTNRDTFRSLCDIACNNIRAMGDGYLLLWIVKDEILKNLLARPPLDNICAILWLLVTLNSEPTELSPPMELRPCTKLVLTRELYPDIITKLGIVLPGYLIDIARCIPKYDHENSMCVNTWERFISPCLSLFDASHKLLHHVLETFASLITGSSLSLPSHDQKQYATDRSNTIDAIVSILHVMHECPKAPKILPSFKEDVSRILHNISCLQSSEEISLNLEERQKVQCAVNELKRINEDALVVEVGEEEVAHGVDCEDDGRRSCEKGG